MERKASFSQRHPLLFGLILIATAMVLFFGTMAFFRIMTGEGDFSFGSSGKIGLVRIEGLITDSGPATEWMSKLADDPEVKGVLLRVDSPAGWWPRPRSCTGP